MWHMLSTFSNLLWMLLLQLMLLLILLTPSVCEIRNLIGSVSLLYRIICCRSSICHLLLIRIISIQRVSFVNGGLIGVLPFLISRVWCHWGSSIALSKIFILLIPYILKFLCFRRWRDIYIIGYFVILYLLLITTLSYFLNIAIDSLVRRILDCIYSIFDWFICKIKFF